MDALDRRIVNALQDGIPVCERPFADVAGELGITDEVLLWRLDRLLDTGVLSRFGPMYDAERMGGGVTLAAMAVPADRFEAVAEIVNGFPEVAHNYRREHRFNMWFVVACEDPTGIAGVLDRIRARTGLPVMNLPKLEAFFLELRLSA